MKKLLWASLVVMVSLVSCEDKGQGVGIMDSGQQKEKLETIANSLMAELSASEVEDVVKTLSSLRNSLISTIDSETYDLSQIYDQIEQREDDIYDYEETTPYDITETWMLLFSHVKGHVTLGPTAATYEDANNSRVTYTDEKGVVWDMELTPVGTEKSVYLGEVVRTGISVDAVTGEERIESEYKIRITVGVPEQLVVSLKRNGADYVTMTYTFDVAISSGGVNVNRDKVSIGCSINFANYNLTVNKTAFNASTGKLEASSVLTKGGKLIVSEKVSAEVEGIDTEEPNARNIEVEVDIMGAMQIKGACANLMSIVEIFQESRPQSAKDWERIVNNVNTKFNINVYYDGSNAVQSIMNLEPRWEDDDYYWAEFALEFSDGSRYLFDEYFGGKEFEGVFNNFELFIEDYEELFERYFDFL